MVCRLCDIICCLVLLVLFSLLVEATPAMKVYLKIGYFYSKPVGWLEERNPTQ
jgi:hypothetical protein